MQVVEGMRDSVYEQVVGDSLQELVFIENVGKDKDEVQSFVVDALTMLRQAALIQIEQPLDAIHEVFLQHLELLLVGLEWADPCDFPAHQVCDAHELMLAELLVVLRLDCWVDVSVVAGTDSSMGQTASACENFVREYLHSLGGFSWNCVFHQTLELVGQKLHLCAIVFDFS